METSAKRETPTRRRLAGARIVLLAAVVALLPAHASAEEEAKKDLGELRVRMGGAAAFADGDAAQFRQRHGIDDEVTGGIESLHYEKEIGEDTELEIDGRAIIGNHDYLLGMKIQNEEKGWFTAGYRQFRTWYDGSGGYFPPADASFTPFDRQLGLDRGEAWAKGGLLLPNDFTLTVGYRYLLRNGTKSSTTWGESTALGLPAPNTQRRIVPAFQQIDEDRHFVDVDLVRRTDTSEAGGGFRYENTNLDDRRNVFRSPGEPAERVVTERDGSQSDVFATRVFGMRRLLDNKLTVSGAYAYNDIDLDLAGSRIYGSTINPSFDPNFPARQHRDEGFFDLSGAAEMSEHVGNLSMFAAPHEDVQILGAVRIRGERRNGHSDFIESSVGASPTFTTSLEELEGRSDMDEMSYAEELEIRYRGIDDVVLYTRGAWEQVDSDIVEQELEPEIPAVAIERKTSLDRLRQEYAAGAKYYPFSWWHLSSEYAYRISDYDYDHHLDSTPNDSASGDRYPAYIVSQEFMTHDLSFRSTFRLPYDVGLVARYDWLRTTIDSRQDLLSEIEAGEIRAHVFSGTVSWNPVAWWWTQAGFNYMLSTTDTSANNYVTPVAPFSPSFDNDYVLVRASSGAAVDDLTDLELMSHWMSANNYQDLSASTVAYGSRFEEHGIGFNAKRRCGEHTTFSLGYGYFVNDESFAGGNYDYDAHIVTSSVELEY